MFLLSLRNQDGLQGQTADKIQQTPGVDGFIVLPDLQFYHAVLNNPGGQAMDNA